MRGVLFIPIYALIALLGCINIEQISQQDNVKAGENFKVEVTGLLGDTTDLEGSVYYGIAGVLIPQGWEIEDAYFEGTVEGQLDEVKRLGTALDLEYPTPEGYEWFGFITTKGYEVTEKMKNGKVNVVFKIKTTEEKGSYSLDYRLGTCTDATIISSDLMWGEHLERMVIDVE